MVIQVTSSAGARLLCKRSSQGCVCRARGEKTVLRQIRDSAQWLGATGFGEVSSPRLPGLKVQDVIWAQAASGFISASQFPPSQPHHSRRGQCWAQKAQTFRGME